MLELLISAFAHPKLCLLFLILYKREEENSRALHTALILLSAFLNAQNLFLPDFFSCCSDPESRSKPDLIFWGAKFSLLEQVWDYLTQKNVSKGFRICCRSSEMPNVSLLLSQYLPRLPVELWLENKNDMYVILFFPLKMNVFINAESTTFNMNFVSQEQLWVCSLEDVHSVSALC